MPLLEDWASGERAENEDCKRKREWSRVCGYPSSGLEKTKEIGSAYGTRRICKGRSSQLRWPKKNDYPPGPLSDTRSMTGGLKRFLSEDVRAEVVDLVSDVFAWIS
jgi:hypothetical protein